MAKFTDVMRWVAQLDNSDVLKGFKEIEDQGTKSLDEVGDKSEGLGDRFKGAGGKMGKALVAGFAAVGVGAIILGEIDKAFARQDSLNVVRGRFALTAEEAKKYGKIAGDLYADGWGEGIEEVQQAVAVTFEKLEVESEEAGKKLARDALAVAKTWDTDVDAVIRSVGQLMQNDLVDSSQDAMDLVVAAFQEGGDEAGDLLDTIDEYSQHWAAMGLSGEDALNQIVHGFQNGQRDADKMADAVKEMGIRIREGSDPVREALQDIGLDADDVIEAFLEGGPRARDAFLDVVDGLAQGQAQGEDTENAVALIGTQFEDLGPTALESLAMVDGALENTEGKAEDLAGMVEATEWERFQRRGEGALAAMGDTLARKVNEPLDALNQLWDISPFGDKGDATKQSKLVKEAVGEVKGEVDELTESIHDQIDAAIEAKETDEDLEHGLDELKRITDLTKDATKRKAEADREAKRAADEHRESIRHVRDEIGHLKREIDDEQAWLNLQRSMDDTIAKLEEGEGSAIDQRLAIVDLREEVLEYAESINLPAVVTTKLDVLLDQGKVNEVKWLLAQWGNGITLPIKPYVINTGTGTSIHIDSNGNVRSGRAAGGPVAPGGLYPVGEGGKPELLESGGRHYLIPGDQRGSVTPARHAGGDVAGGGSGSTYVYSPMFDGGEAQYQQFVRFVDEHERRKRGAL